MKKRSSQSLMAVLAIILFVSLALPGFSQDEKLTTPGSVWELTFVKLKPHSGDTYLKGLKQTWKASMDEMVKAGLVKSYKILWGDATNPEDFNLLLMIEFANYAAFDPNPEQDKKIDEIEKKIRDNMGDEYLKTVEGYQSLRELLGTKVMREITIN
jgi:hypothetical protein